MYGIVNLAVENLVVSSHGEEVWTQIREQAGITDISTFVTTENYPDDVTYRLVGAISSRLGVSNDEVLRIFGRHWITYTKNNGYDELLRFAGSSAREFLSNVDVIHAHVAAGMPVLKTPTIEVEEVEDGHFLVHYRSPRQGLAAMVLGLLEGIGEMFDTPLKITHVDRLVDGADHDVFSVLTPVLC